MADSVHEQRNAASPAGDRTSGETFVSQMTAHGRGAIAVLRVWGPAAIEIVDTVFRPNRGARLAESPREHLRVGRIGGGLGDEVVVAVLGGDSPAVEVQCHGGVAAVALVIEALQAAGATIADGARSAGQLSEDPITRDALVDLARAPTVTTAEILLDQVQGALTGELVRLRRSIAETPLHSLATIETLTARGQLGLRLLDGWRVVIAGRPNVGKSCLFNAIVGFARAIVDPAEGTTRDVVSHKVVFGGWPVELADTAGLRVSSDPVESIGIERSRREQQEADLVVLVLDRSVPLQPIDHELIASQPTAIIAANKSDLPPAWHADEPSFRSRAVVTVSAEQGDGLNGLIDVIGRQLVPEPPPKGGAVPFRRDQMEQLSQIRLSLLADDRTAALDRLEVMVLGRVSANQPESARE